MTAAVTDTTHSIGFFELKKYDAKTGKFSGVLASERPDRAGEILDYEKSKPYFKRWMEASRKASGGKSLGPVREMHQPTVAAGKLTKMVFNDAKKQVEVEGVVVEPLAMHKMAEGIYTGLSVGGSYEGDPWTDPTDATKVRYIANPTEASLADIPCNPDATFALVGADGLTKTQKFAPPPPEIIEARDEEFVPSLAARTIAAAGGRPLRKSFTRTPMDNQATAISEADLKRALKKIADKRAAKQTKKAMKKAFAFLFTDDESPLKKQLGAFATKDDLKKSVDGLKGTIVTVFAAMTAESDKEDDLKKAAANVIRLLPDDEGKTGEGQSDEEKELRKVIAEKQAELKKIAGGKGGAAGDERRILFADAI